MFGVGLDLLSFEQALAAIIFASLVSYLSFRLNLLTISGSAAAFFIGILVFSGGGLKWAAPIITFFLLSSILSKLNNKNNFAEKGSRRDYIQVLANGGFGICLLVINLFENSELLFIGYVSSLAAAAADTWETEFGTYRGGTTYDIFSFQRTEPGTSGGVSAAGFFGGLLGTLTIIISSLYWVERNWKLFFFIIIIAGMAGSIIDSFLGAVFQRKNKCSMCGIVTERSMHCGNKTGFYRGARWLNNDTVNFAGTAFGGLFGILLTEMFKE